MEETTSRTLVVIMVATLFIALFGSVATLNKFGGLRAITGAWSENSTTTHGAVNLTISSNLIVNFTDDTVNFGSGYLCSGTDSATIATDGTNTTSSNCGWNIPNGLMLENQGNRKASLLLYHLKNSSGFFGDPKSGYALKWETPESSGAANRNATCMSSNSTLLAFADTYVNMTAIFLDGENWTLCDMFNYSDLTDKINFSFKLHIDQGATTGTKADTWTIVARDQGQ